jgi:predicted O-linked N-acetylglucosamine transferase (SPINDLY family)
MTELSHASSMQDRLARAARHARLQPRDYAAQMEHASALHAIGHSSEALEPATAALGLRPHERDPAEMRALALLDRGEIDAGLAAWRELDARFGVDADAGHRRLVFGYYDPAQTVANLYEAVRERARRRVRPIGPPFRAAGSADPERPLRVGWISPRFAHGPVASFLAGLLDAFDRRRFRHVTIALRKPFDATGRALFERGDETVDADSLTDAELLARLRETRLDIAIDLAGHATGNRIEVLAQRVAPLQLCWLDWFDTTAVPAMDGWISDAWLTPADSAQRYTERVLRVPYGRFCYTPPAVAPEASRTGNGPPVFAAFHRPARFNERVLDAWAAILGGVPTARLVLGARLLEDRVARANLVGRFAARGIDAQRLQLAGRRDYGDLLAAYREADIALDPFPFSGCTTTCDALWMGCAVVSLPGETFVSRQSASLLWRIGRDDWVANDAQGYIERAVELARDVEALRRGRADLRAAVREKLCDANAQAADFAGLLRMQWRAWCARQHASEATS